MATAVGRNRWVNRKVAGDSTERLGGRVPGRGRRPARSDSRLAADTSRTRRRTSGGSASSSRTTRYFRICPWRRTSHFSLRARKGPKGAPCKSGRAGPDKTLTFSDYAVVIQAALLSQGIALGWLTVASHALTTSALLPAASTLARTSRRCVLLGSPRRPLRPIVAQIRAWIIAELHREIHAIDEAHPSLGVRAACQ